MKSGYKIILAIILIFGSIILMGVAFAEELNVPFDQAYFMELGFVGIAIGIIWIVRTAKNYKY